MSILLKNQPGPFGRERRLDEILAQLNEVKNQGPRGPPNSTVLGEISKNICEIKNKIDENGFKIDHLIDVIDPLVTGFAKMQERTDNLEREFQERTANLEHQLETVRNDFELLSYVQSIKQDSNNFEFKRRIEEVALALRKAFQILKDLIPEKVYEEEEVEKMIKVNAIWATISVALSKLINLAVLCPTGNDSFDEQAAAKWGFCRESCDYENFSESLFAKTLNDLEKFTTAKEGSSARAQQLRFTPNLQNREVQGVSKTKIKKLDEAPGEEL